MNFKYETGSRVQNLDNQQFAVIQSRTVGMDGALHYYITYDNEWFSSETVPEHALKLIESRVTKHNRCECGAWITSFSQIHSTWCPEHGKF